MQIIKKRKFNRKYVLAFAILVIFFAGGILCFLKNPSAFDLEKLKTKEIESPVDYGTDWNIYKNENYKYEIQYPKDWKFFEGGQEQDPDVLNVTRFFTKTLVNSIIKIRVYQNPNENYQKILQGEENVLNPLAVEKRNGKYCFLISYFGQKEGKKIFEEMISTFKFTN